MQKNFIIYYWDPSGGLDFEKIWLISLKMWSYISFIHPTFSMCTSCVWRRKTYSICWQWGKFINWRVSKIKKWKSKFWRSFAIWSILIILLKGRIRIEHAEIFNLLINYSCKYKIGCNITYLYICFITFALIHIWMLQFRHFEISSKNYDLSVK